MTENVLEMCVKRTGRGLGYELPPPLSYKMKGKKNLTEAHDQLFPDFLVVKALKTGP